MWFDGGVWVGVGTIRSTEFYSPEDHGRPALRFEGRSDSPLPRFISVRNSVLSCANAETLCLEWMRASAEIVSNRLIGRGGIRGSGLIKGNVMTLDLSETRVAIESSGNTQIVHNIILNQSGVGKGIIFTGGPNDPTPEYPGAAIDGNIIIGVAIGIGFQDGINNHFGNNRVSATRPFSNTDGQIDWGGNVSF